MGSSSLTDSGSSSPPNSSIESLNGLKFGKKIYFEGAGSSSAASGGSGSGTPPKKVRSGGAAQGGQPPRCQVEGCRVDLSDAKAYYSRHKVCGMHSKSPKVTVGGIEQRFCQQCSRFHQLTEFDQGKRSCRRRLAGHNERRRKPPPGSLLSSRYGRFSSSGFDNSSRMGSFLMDFTAYPRVPSRDEWPSVRSSDRGPGNQTNGPGKFFNHPWQNNSENPPHDPFLQGSTGGAGYSTPTVSPGECFTGIGDTTCALSLLSNQPWGSRNQSSALGVNHIMHAEGSPISHSTPHGTAFNHFPNASWAVKAIEASGSSNGIPQDLGLCQYSETLNSQFSGEHELSQQSRRQYMELDHPTRAYDSTHQMHWSL